MGFGDDWEDARDEEARKAKEGKLSYQFYNSHKGETGVMFRQDGSHEVGKVVGVMGEETVVFEYMEADGLKDLPQKVSVPFDRVWFESDHSGETAIVSDMRDARARRILADYAAQNEGPA